jgi:hypothetical protein
MSNCPALLEEFTNKFFPPELQALLAHERNSKTGHVGKVSHCAHISLITMARVVYMKWLMY